jgi:leucyl aminopeptidase
MKITFAKPETSSKGIVVVTANTGNKLSPSAKILDVETGGALVRAIRASRFEGKKAQTLNIIAPELTKLDRIMIVGLGKSTDITNIEMQNLGGRIYAATKQAKNGLVSIVLDTVVGSKLNSNEMAAEIGYGAKLRSYSFLKYKTQIKADQKVAIKTLKITCDNIISARKNYNKLSKVAEGVFFARDLVSEPPNILYPETLAKEAKTLEKFGIKVQILGESQMRRLGMGALLGVGQGSVRESKLVVMQWNGGPKSKSSKPIAFVGKGVTFDTDAIGFEDFDLGPPFHCITTNFDSRTLPCPTPNNAPIPNLRI